MTFRMTFRPVIPGSDRVSLLLQRFGRVGAGGAGNLDEDGGKGNKNSKDDGERIDPPMVPDPIYEAVEVSSAGEDCDRKCDDAGDEDYLHIFPYTACSFLLDSTSIYFPDGDVRCAFRREICAHRNKSHK